MVNPYSSPSSGGGARASVMKRYSWPALALQFAILGAVMFVGAYFPQKFGGTFWAPGIYIALLFGLRLLIPRAHRRGIRYVRSGQYEFARECFLESYDFFTRHAWLDRYRAITMLTPSYLSYREMALYNAGYCSMQIGDAARGKELYEKTLEEFPHNALAASALNMIQSVENNQSAPRPDKSNSPE